MLPLLLLLGWIILALIGLNAVAFVHELGHYAAGKICRLSVAEFSVGLGRKVFELRFRETRFVFRRYPILGYVLWVRSSRADYEIEELEPDRESPRFKLLSDPKGWMMSASLKAKLFILLAGPAANVVMYFALSALCYQISDDRTYPTSPVRVAAASSGEDPVLCKGDLIEAIGEIDRPSPNEVTEHLGASGESVRIALKRDGERKIVYVDCDRSLEATKVSQPRDDFEWQAAAVCIFAQYSVPYGNARWECSPYYLSSFGCGPIGILHLGVRPISHGFVPYLAWIAVLSLIVGISNLMPVPPLDGGRIVLAILKSILSAVYLIAVYIVWRFPSWLDREPALDTDAPPPPKRRGDFLTTAENTICLAGCGCLLLFLVYVSFVDVLRILVSIRTL